MNRTESDIGKDITGLGVRPKLGLGRRLARLARLHPIGAIGASVVIVLVAISICAPLLAPYDPTSQITKRLQQPNAKYLLGTDDLGRDVLSRLIFGSRVSLYVGVISVSIALALGVPIGILTGYLGGQFDNLVMRLVDIMLAFPSLVLAIVFVGVLGPSLQNAMLAIGIVAFPGFARVARGCALSVKQEVYIEAARVVGASNFRILRIHVLRNVTAPLIVLATLSLSGAILTEAGLSFLGLGTQPPDPSWGIMLSTGRTYMEQVPGLAIFPGLAIVVAVLAFNLLGDGLRDALDPRLRR